LEDLLLTAGKREIANCYVFETVSASWTWRNDAPSQGRLV